LSNAGSTSQIEAAASQALARGDALGARKIFERLVTQEPRAVSAWLGLSRACHALNDSDASLAAADRALALDPRDLRALLLKGDVYSGRGEERTACTFYTAALRQAAALQSASPDLINELRRAKTATERYAANYEAHLRARLADSGFDAQSSSQRFAQSIDLMLGKKRVYMQQPSQYYFPELPQVQFYDRKDFPWVEAIEAATDDIRAELMNVLKDEDAFRPYVERVPNRPPPDDASMAGNPDWGAYFLWKDGKLVPEHAARCPKTVRAVENAPLCRIPNRTPSVLFSRLKPGARIPPHTGYINTRLICHLPLIVPEKCFFRVGNDERQWTVGKTLLFDDTIEHEARNDSTETRVVLIFEIWRPELTIEEQRLVAATLEAIDTYGSGAAPWGT